MNIEQTIQSFLEKKIKDSTNEEIYNALLNLIKSLSNQKEVFKSKKKVYYISSEFLIGKLLVSNLMGLGILQEVSKVLEKNGKSLEKIEQTEPEPSLGNGGLGRLAACFMDSAAAMNIACDGVGLLYRFGLFKQSFENMKQTEKPDKWVEKNSILKETPTCFEISFGGFCVKSRMYDIDVVSPEGKNIIHLFEPVDATVEFSKNSIDFDKTDINKNLTLFLYPDDSDENGRRLRVYQQYFMVSNAARLIIKEAKEKGSSLFDLYEYAVVQINDTHPSMIIPELIRLLLKEGIYIDKAIEIVSKMCAYTNHTILQEALEKWEFNIIKEVAPDIAPIIEILDSKVRRKFSDKALYIIDDEERVHMARMDIHCSKSVNGVAALHTEILKKSELKEFYNIYPEKFNNKTNGITFRRWLIKANPELSDLLKDLLGDEVLKDFTKIKKLETFQNDKQVLNQILNIKKQNKENLYKYILDNRGIKIDTGAIFDMQIKRLHEYKRQQMNALEIINKYLQIKNGIFPKRPILAVFGAKAAPAYTIAKDIIHVILCLERIIQQDETANKYLKVVMVENYNVTSAERLIPACDISEQISLASKEASGTGNMKFMLNGAITLGTMDGANVEIHSLVGDENIYIFGKDSKSVINAYETNSYDAKKYYQKNESIKQAVDFLTSKQMTSIGDITNLERLKNELLYKDWFMSFADFEDYKNKREIMYKDYEKREDWAKKMLINIANSGYFSSDRTIREYNEDIWKIK